MTDLAPAFERLAQRRGRGPRQRFGEAWERQTGETTRAWAAFTIYRDLGTDRTLGRVHAHPEVTASRKSIDVWSAANHWVDRAKAFDAYLDRRKVEVAAQEIEEMQQRQIRAGMALQETGLRFVEEQLDTPEGRKDMTATAAARFIELGVNTERKARGVDDANRVDIDVNVRHELDPTTKAALFDQIGRMASNIAAVRELGASQSTIPVASQEVEDLEAQEDDGEGGDDESPS